MNRQTKLTAREIDALEDMRVLSVSRAQGAYGTETARKHANLLMQRAAAAFGTGNVDEAVWLAERELNFNCHVFGFRHRFTITSIAALRALRLYISAGNSQSAADKTVKTFRAHVA